MEWKDRNRQAEGDDPAGRIDVEAPGYSVLGQGGGGISLGGLLSRPLVPVALLVVMALLLGLALLRKPGGGGPESAERMVRLESRIDQIGQRVEAQASRSSSQIDPVDLQRQLDAIVKRLDRTEAVLAQRIAALEHRPGVPTVAAAPQAPTPKAAASSPAPDPKSSAPKAKAKADLYTVKPGDTLYSISRSANLTVEKLRQLNKLTPEATIHPGDQLKVAP